MTALTWLSDDVVGFAAGAANAYLWRHGATATLVDAGQADSEGTILEALRGIGLEERDLVRIVLTHWHDDHVGGAAALARRTGAQVCAGRADAAVVRGEVPGMPARLTAAEEPLMERLAGEVPPAPRCRVDRELDDGDVLDAPPRPGGAADSRAGAVVVGCPGHTPGSIAVHLPGRRVVLTGDVAVQMEGVTLGPFNTDRGQAWRSLRRLAALEVDAVGVGHGPPIVGDPDALGRATDPLA